MNKEDLTCFYSACFSFLCCSKKSGRINATSQAKNHHKSLSTHYDGWLYFACLANKVTKHAMYSWQWQHSSSRTKPQSCSTQSTKGSTCQSRSAHWKVWGNTFLAENTDSFVTKLFSRNVFCWREPREASVGVCCGCPWCYYQGLLQWAWEFGSGQHHHVGWGSPSQWNTPPVLGPFSHHELLSSFYSTVPAADASLSTDAEETPEMLRASWNPAGW